MKSIFSTSQIQALRSRWVRLEFAQSFRGQPVRPLLRFHRLDGVVEEHILPAAVLGKARWIGFAPADLTRLEILTVGDEATEIWIEAVRPISEFQLAWMIAKRRGLALPRYLYARLTGPRASGVLARSVLDLDSPERFDSFKGGRARACEPDGLDAAPAEPALVTPSLSFVMSVDGGDLTSTVQTLKSLAKQIDPAVRLVVGVRSGKTEKDLRARLDELGLGEMAEFAEIGTHEDPDRAAIRISGAIRSDWIGCLKPGDVLAPEAVLLLRDFVACNEEFRLVYADSLARLPGGGLRPSLKPDWSPAFLDELNYVGRPCLFRASILKGLLSKLDSADPDPWWAATRAAGEGRSRAEIGHLKRLLLEHPTERQPERRRRSRAAPAARSPATRATIIIPTRDRVDLLQEAVSSIVETLSGRSDYEVVVVDNDSAEPRTLAYLASIEDGSRIRVLRHPGPFNFPDLANAGAEAASGDVLVLLNNDCMARDRSWLDALTALARQADVGAVGAVLLYEDGRLQHAGVALGLGGEAGHRDRKLPADHRGSLQRLRAVHEVSAVTAACLAVERRKYLEVGGFDRAFAVAFNDIDFCLRLQERGYRNLLTPEAVLIHAESASRGQDTGPKRERFKREASLFRERWRALVHDDPYFHPLFSTARFNDLLG